VAGSLIVFLAVSALVRLALLTRAHTEFDASAGAIARIFAFGIGSDLRAACYAAPPFALLLLLPGRWYRSLAVRVTFHAVAITGLFVLLFSALAEWFFWGEFSARMNFIAVDYLVYTREVLQNIWESYPVVPLLGAALAAALTLWLLVARRQIAGSFDSDESLRVRGAGALGLVAAPLLCFTLSGGPVPEVSQSRVARELGANGLYTLFSAFRNNQLDYEPFYVTEDRSDAAATLRRLLSEPSASFASGDTSGLVRDVRAARPERKPNVVLIVVESLSARFLGSFGNGEGLTPNLDALANQSLLFTNLRATGTRTVRGLEAVTLSVPPTPGYSIVKRPENANLFSIGTVFRERGYHTRFFYGGYAFFDNMAAFFGGNGFDVIDRADLAPDESGFANAWGVSDEFVLKRVLREARRSHEAGEPFFSVVMTTSNHRPFTYPDGRIDIPSGKSRAGAVKYTDFALGQFLADARKEPFFADTLFVIVADHCASSAGDVEIPVTEYHIPMFFYAPGFIAPGRVDTLASQMDLAPTLFAQLGWSYRSRFFGRDILATPASDSRALLGTYQRLGYYKGGLLTVLSPGQQVDVFQVEPDGSQRAVAASAADGRLTEAIAYYQSASAVYGHPPGQSLLAQR
jgi:phosphoglycerol transferase MdoB-like AlkP superfamily enzyme